MAANGGRSPALSSVAAEPAYEPDTYEPECTPPVDVQYDGDRVVYDAPDVEPPLLEGDQILSVDGRALDAQGRGRWYGDCDSQVLLRVYRPATRATFTVRTTRTAQPEDD